MYLPHLYDTECAGEWVGRTDTFPIATLLCTGCGAVHTYNPGNYAKAARENGIGDLMRALADDRI
jgi:hypothetical protein